MIDRRKGICVFERLKAEGEADREALKSIHNVSKGRRSMLDKIAKCGEKVLFWVNTKMKQKASSCVQIRSKGKGGI